MIVDYVKADTRDWPVSFSMGSLLKSAHSLGTTTDALFGDGDVSEYALFVVLYNAVCAGHDMKGQRFKMSQDEFIDALLERPRLMEELSSVMERHMNEYAKTLGVVEEEEASEDAKKK